MFEGDLNLCFFVRSCLDLSIDAYYRLRNAPGGSVLAYQIIDSLCSMLVMIARRSSLTEVSLIDSLTRILSVVVLCLTHAHETRKELFDQRPFLRLFSTLFEELSVLIQSNSFPNHQYDLLVMLTNTLVSLRPSFVPGFVFAWLQLVSHRRLMPLLLEYSDRKVCSIMIYLCSYLYSYSYS